MVAMKRYVAGLLLAAFLVAPCFAESPDGTIAVAPSSVTDNNGVVWSLSSTGSVLRNNYVRFAWTGKQLLWSGHALYLQGNSGAWYALDRSSGKATPTTDPRIVVTPTPVPIPAPTPTAPPSGPIVTLDATTVAAGSSIVAHMRDAASGSTRDWVSLAPVGSSPSVYMAYTYVGDGNTSFDWTIAAPLVPGTYEIRFLTHEGPNLAATSPPITVTGTMPVVPPMVGTSVKPDIIDLDFSDEATVLASGTWSAPYANEPEFKVDASGMKYMRFSSFPSDSRLISGFLPFAARDEIWTRYVLMIEPDVVVGMNENGVKLPGPRSAGTGEISARLEHEKLNAQGKLRLIDYLYDAESGAGFGSGGYEGIDLFAGMQWWVFEQHAKLNTPTLSDGVYEVYVNGTLTHAATTVRWRDNPATRFDQFHANVYHGGTTPPFKKIHYRIAKIGVSSTRIGVPAELLPLVVAPVVSVPAVSPSTSAWPAWRRSMTVKDKLYPITGTANLAGLPDQDNPPTPTSRGGRNWQDIDTWNGFAAGPTTWWGVAVGGHNGQWSNKVFKIDFAADVPTWTMEYAGSPYAQVPSYTQMDAGLSYYFDGLPTARHTYYANQFIGKRNRVMLFYDGASYGGVSNGFPTVDGYRLDTKLYDPKGTWSQSSIFSGLGANSRVPTAAKHPITEDVYLANNSVFTKWTQVTGTWSDVTITGAGSGSAAWQFHGSLVDGKRNRWVYVPDAGGELQWIDLTDNSFHRLPGVTTLPLASGNSTYGALAHDLDGDRYLWHTGTTIYAINPDTAVTTKLTDAPAPVNGVLGRFACFQAVGGCAYLPQYASDIQFLPTR